MLPDSGPRLRRADFRRSHNYYIARLSEYGATPLRWASRLMAGGAFPTPPTAWRKGLLLGPDHIGDVLYNTPALPALRAGLPQCEWTYLTPSSAGEVLQGNPHLSRIITHDEPRDEWLKENRDQLRQSGFDVAIAYTSGSAWHDLGEAIRLGIPNRVGYVDRGFSGLVTHPVNIRRPQPFAAYFRDLVMQLIENRVETPQSLRPLIYTTAVHEAQAEALALRLGLDRNGPPILACAVTSRQPSGVWPEKSFLEAIRWIRERITCPIVYIGAASDAAQLHRFSRETGPGTSVIAGDLDLPSMVCFLRRCRAALTTDSAPRHLANAAEIPVVFVRNLLFRHVEAGAYCATDHDMAPPNFEMLSPEEQSAAFARITPESVGARVLSLLQKPA